MKSVWLVIALALAPMAQAQKPTKTADCREFETVFAAAPGNFNSFRGPKDDKGNVTGTASLAGIKECIVDTVENGIRIYGCLDMNKTEAHARAQYRALLSKAQACLAGWQVSRTSGTPQDITVHMDGYRFEKQIPAGRLIVVVVLSRGPMADLRQPIYNAGIAVTLIGGPAVS